MKTSSGCSRFISRRKALSSRTHKRGNATRDTKTCQRETPAAALQRKAEDARAGERHGKSRSRQSRPAPLLPSGAADEDERVPDGELPGVVVCLLLTHTAARAVGDKGSKLTNGSTWNIFNTNDSRQLS